MRILVTGALGHIGSELIRYLPSAINSIKEIIMIDNLSTQRFCSLYNLPYKKYRFIEGDIRNLDINLIISEVDYVIHLAAITDATKSFYNSEEVENNNYNCTEIIANACLKSRSKLIMLSSTSVYGTQDKIVNEDCLIEDLQPQSPYAKTKLREENLVKEMNKKGLEVVCCRLGTIYGDSIGMRFHTAVNKFCWQAALGETLTVWSSAYEQMRPYLDLRDAIRSFEHIIKINLFDGEIYNILTENLTVKNVIDEIRKFIPNIDITFVDNKIMNQLSYEVSNKKFKNTGFQFKGSINDGIKNTLKKLPIKF
jgi:nucleoside-diphosphate-sugar epimerase